MDASRIRILFVDDQQRELEGISQMMRWDEMGLEIAGAVTNAQAALDIVNREPVDIVVTDVIMQNMDGLALVKELTEHHPGIRAVCISGFDDFKFVSMAMNNGAAGYVLKPILANEMKSVLERVIGSIRAARARSRCAFDRGRLAMLCMGAEGWQDGLDDETLDRPVRVACVPPGAELPGESWVLLRLSDSSSICVLADHHPPVSGDFALSDPMPLRLARQGYLQICASLTGGPQPGDTVERIMRNIDDHLSEELDGDTLMRGVYLSASYANVLFKEATGMTVHRYVIKRRLEQAVEMMLDNPETLIKDIAWRCGFADASHFINSFRQVYHMTPDKYRRKHAADDKKAAGKHHP